MDDVAFAQYRQTGQLSSPHCRRHWLWNLWLHTCTDNFQAFNIIISIQFLKAATPPPPQPCCIWTHFPTPSIAGRWVHPGGWQKLPGGGGGHSRDHPANVLVRTL